MLGVAISPVSLTIQLCKELREPGTTPHGEVPAWLGTAKLGVDRNAIEAKITTTVPMKNLFTSIS
jgi:hypothetical protein